MFQIDPKNNTTSSFLNMIAFAFLAFLGQCSPTWPILRRFGDQSGAQNHLNTDQKYETRKLLAFYWFRGGFGPKHGSRYHPECGQKQT